MTTTVKKTGSIHDYIRQDRMPHIWCPGCGLGTVLRCLISALIGGGYPMDKVAVVSGIGCTGRAAGYVKLDSFHTTHGRAIPFATGLKLANPELKVVVFSGDGDLVSIGRRTVWVVTPLLLGLLAYLLASAAGGIARFRGYQPILAAGALATLVGLTVLALVGHVLWHPGLALVVAAVSAVAAAGGDFEEEFEEEG